MPGAALAQEAGATAGNSATLDEIVVTARKRVESLQEIPLAITAFVASDLEAADIGNLEDIARLSPGMQFAKQGGQTPGRVDSVIRFRGMSVSSTAPSRQVGALFLDGIYVLGNAHSLSLDDVQRVEVIKGPQAAYFGRNTFGGAVNYVTNTPSLIETSGKVSTKFSHLGDAEFSGALEMPLIEDKLAVRIGGRHSKNAANYTASDGGRLGEEVSEMAYLTLYAEPTDRWSAKFRLHYGQDSDSPPAGALIAGRQNDSCTGLSFTTPAGDTATPKEFICGEVPSMRSAVPIMNVGNIVDSNTSLHPQRAALVGRPNIIVDRLVNMPFPSRFGSMPSIDRMGLERELIRASLSTDYEVTDSLTATLQAAYSDSAQVNLRDYGPSAFENWFVRDGVAQTDTSAEFRLAFDNGGKLSWLAGVSYYTQDYIGSANSGDVVALCVDTLNDATNPPDDQCSEVRLIEHDANNDEIESLGFFGAINYQFTDQLHLSLEGRYQMDENAQGVTRTISSEYETFLPRAIFQYTPTSSTNLYASYAEGVLPGAVNQRLVDADAQETAQYLALYPGAQGSTDEEKIANYEIGWKQSLLDGRMRFAIAAYYAKWEQMKAAVTAVINETCRSASGIGCRPAMGEARLGEPARFSSGDPFYSARGLTVSGASDLYGIEIDGQVQLTENFDAGFTYSYAGSEFTDFIFVRVEGIAGFRDVAGYQLPRFPEHSGSANFGYTKEVSDDLEFFSRFDVFYTGKTYADEANLAHCKGYATANLRGGVQTGRVRMEAFVTNLTDDDNWTTCSRWTDFENPTVYPASTARQGVALSAPDPREFGVRFSYSF